MVKKGGNKIRGGFSFFGYGTPAKLEPKTLITHLKTCLESIKKDMEAEDDKKAIDYVINDLDKSTLEEAVKNFYEVVKTSIPKYNVVAGPADNTAGPAPAGPAANATADTAATATNATSGAATTKGGKRRKSLKKGKRKCKKTMGRR